MSGTHFLLVKCHGGFVFSFARTSKLYIHILKIMHRYMRNSKVHPLNCEFKEKFANFANIPHGQKKTILQCPQNLYKEASSSLFQHTKTESSLSLSNSLYCTSLFGSLEFSYSKFQFSSFLVLSVVWCSLSMVVFFKCDIVQASSIRQEWKHDIQLTTHLAVVSQETDTYHPQALR